MPPVDGALHAEQRPAATTVRVPIEADWEAAPSAPGAHEGPGSIEALDWFPASVPGTAAGVLRERGAGHAERDLDGEDWWFRTTFAAEPAGPDEQVLLAVGGVATVWELYLNGELLLEGDSMFAPRLLDVGAHLRAQNELAICCRALTPLLARPRKPRARWRTRIVAEGGLRFYRTMLLGRAPGFAPAPATVGPWREIAIERRRGVSLERFRVRSALHGEEGTLAVTALLRALGARRLGSVELELCGPSGTHRERLELEASEGGVRASRELRIARPALWWPHTHGEPVLHDVRLHVLADGEPLVFELGRTGFRTLAAGGDPAHEPERDGLDLHVNDRRVFVRGAVWTPLDIVGMAVDEPALRQALGLVRDAGMNMLRLPGTGAYESRLFHDLCDELGIMVWQDMMFANFDYPIADEHFRSTVAAEIEEVLSGLGARPSTVVVCGNSEVEQQVAMLGLDSSLGRGELFGELLPEHLREAELDAIYVPSAPCGGELPFRPGCGIANYYGVGGYRRPSEDARRSNVRFAAECLAFSNVPDELGVERVLASSPGELVVHHPAWKVGVPRDVGAGWDFEDVRDHYLRERYALDPAELRRTDHERYLELSRMVTGELMAEVFGEWRRETSACGGGLVLWLSDLTPGAGWGVLDDEGRPKAAYHHLRRVLSPVAVWIVDEGLGGLVAHVANDRAEPLTATLRVALYSELAAGGEEAGVTVTLAPHTQASWDVESVIGRFADVSWAYRFGPPAHDAVVVSLEVVEDQRTRLLGQAFHFPAGRPLSPQRADTLSLSARLVGTTAGGESTVALRSERLAYGVRLHVPGHLAEDDAFCLEPGQERLVHLRALGGESFSGGHVTAVNLLGRTPIAR